MGDEMMNKNLTFEKWKKYWIEETVVLMMIFVYLLRNLVMNQELLSRPGSIVIQAIVYPLLYCGLCLWMIVKKKNVTSKLFFQSYLLFAFPLHVMIYYMIFTEFNPIVWFFIGLYLLFSSSYYLFVITKGAKFIRVLFWIIDIILQLIFVYIWVLVIGFQNIS